jgi:hypothetical protein
VRLVPFEEGSATLGLRGLGSTDRDANRDEFCVVLDVSVLWLTGGQQLCAVDEAL